MRPIINKKTNKEIKMITPMFAILPVVILVPVVIAAGGGACLGLWGIKEGISYWIKYRKKHSYLLTGFSHSGKTELWKAVKDLWEKGNRTNHATATTITADSKKIKGREFVVFDDDSGAVDNDREVAFINFITKAIQKPAKYSIIYVIDLRKVNDIDIKRHAKSELSLLQDCVKEVQKKEKKVDQKVELIIVGSHLDLLQNVPLPNNQCLGAFLQNDFRGLFEKIVDNSCFSKRFIAADLYTLEGSKQFVENLFKED